MATIDAKGLLKSKTFWFGALFIITAIANFFGYAEFQPSPGLVGAIGGIIILLRIVTKKPISGLT